MPSNSKKQARFMAAAANNSKFARKAGISQDVAREYHQADKRAKNYQMGGLAAAMPPRGTRPARGIPDTSRNGLIGTSQDQLGRSGARLRHMQRGLGFAKGGKMRKGLQKLYDVWGKMTDDFGEPMRDNQNYYLTFASSPQEALEKVRAANPNLKISKRAVKEIKDTDLNYREELNDWLDLTEGAMGASNFEEAVERALRGPFLYQDE